MSCLKEREEREGGEPCTLDVVEPIQQQQKREGTHADLIVDTTEQKENGNGM